MEIFLQQSEATFYHVTTIENWDSIQVHGLVQKNKEIYVSRVGELPILLAIAFEQIPEIYDSEGFVVLKLPQTKNKFNTNELSPDTNAGVEWTQPFQNCILRNYIPPENIELMMMIKFPDNHLRSSIQTILTSIAASGNQNYPSHSIYNLSQQIQYT